MIAYLFFNQNSPDERDVDYVIERLTGMQVDSKKIEAASPEGTQLGELYDVTSKPAAVLVRDDGQVVERWLGKLPRAEDISYLAHS